MLIDVDNQSVVGAFNCGHPRNREPHALLQLYELQIEICFMLSLKLIPTAEN